jgi:hypothetical protein
MIRRLSLVVTIILSSCAVENPAPNERSGSRESNFHDSRFLMEINYKNTNGIAYVGALVGIGLVKGTLKVLSHRPYYRRLI